MGGPQDAIWQQHRTFLLPDLTAKEIARMPMKIRVPEMGSRIHPGPPTTMGVPDPSMARPGTQRIFAGHRWVAHGMTPVRVQEFDGQRFSDFATPWEKEWSVICKGAINTLSPIVTEDGQVIGHSGRVNSTNIPSLRFVTGIDTYYVLTFVASATTIRQMHLQTPGFSDQTREVITSVDGVVLFQGGAQTRGVEAEDVSPLDLIMGVKLLVDLGAGLGAKLLTVLQKKSAANAERKIAAGLTRELVTSATKKGPLTWEVLAEGEALAGTTVPDWIRIKVGNREFFVGRNANALNKAGQAVGPATKHLAEAVRDVKGPWKPWSRDYPMSALAGGLDEAERRIVSGAAPLHNGQPGVFKVIITEPGQSGWDFTIDTNQTPWRVFHAVISY